jgi:ABC-type Fe3+ transport system substrate-binding protein
MEQMKTGIRYGLILMALFLAFADSLCRHVAASWAEQWDKVVEAAKNEGELRLYCGEDYVSVFAEFQKKYPEIKVISVSSRGSELVSRIMAERRAGKYLADVVITGPSSLFSLHKAKVLDPIRPVLILPEVTDTTKWWKDGQYNYVDEQRQYIFGFNGEVQPFYGFNSKLVKRTDFKSYWDFLNPKWKGKIVILEPAGAQLPAVKPALVHLYAVPELGGKFLRQLFSEMELVASRDTRQITDWLAAGKFSLSMFTIPNRTGLDEAKQQGLPVDWFAGEDLKEGLPVTTASGNVVLANSAPHPNAATLAINWLLSREGQQIYQRLFKGPDSLRIDIPKTDVPPARRRMAGGNYVMTDQAKWMEIQSILDIIKDAWKKKGG